MNILSILDKELNYLPNQLKIEIEYVSDLPFNGKNSCIQKIVDDDQKTGYWFPWKSYLAAWLSDEGTEITLVIKTGTKPSKIHRNLTSGMATALAGTCLSLQSCIAMHANAVSLNNMAIAFAGASGAGKSTLSAYCAMRGAGFITDDLLVVDTVGRVHPGPSRLKLLPNTATNLGLAGASVKQRKLHFHPVDVGATLHTSSVPLGIVYLPTQSPEPAIYSQPLSPVEAAYALLANTYNVFELMPTHSNLFDIYAHLARQISVRRLFYPHDFTALPKVYNFLQAEIEYLNKTLD